MRVPALRVLTALAAIGCAAFAMWRGAAVASFGLAEIEGASAETAPRLDAWVRVPGIAGLALDVALAAPTDPRDAAAVRRHLEEANALAAVRPASPRAWLLVAGARYVAARPTPDVLSALRLSDRTGANEGALMLERGIFGLVIWTALPEDLRRRTASDIAVALAETSVEDKDLTPAREVLAAASAATREDVAARLRAQGVLPGDLKRMGL